MRIFFELGPLAGQWREVPLPVKGEPLRDITIPRPGHHGPDSFGLYLATHRFVERVEHCELSRIYYWGGWRLRHEPSEKQQAIRLR